MVHIDLHGVRALYCVNKDEDDESLPLVDFRMHVVNAISLKYLKEDRLSSNHVVIQNIPSDFVMMTQTIKNRTLNAAK